MKTFNILCILLVASVLFTSCRTTQHLPVYSYEPTTGQIFLQNERKLSCTTKDSISIIIGLDHHNAKEMVFDVLIKNTSKRELAVRPNKFYIRPANASSNDLRCYAVDPEAEIERISQYTPNTFTNKLLHNSISCCLTTLMNSICSELTGIKQSEEEVNNTINREMTKNENLETPSFLREKEEKLALWQNFALRTSVVHPNQQITGKIYFKFDVALPVYELNLLIGDQLINTTFTQYIVTTNN